MRAAFYETTGPARDVLRVREVDRPEPGPGDVRVRMEVSGINQTDVKTRDGSTPRPMGRVGELEGRIPHQDGVGEIDAVGEGVDSARIGERVWLWLASASRPWGTAAEWSVVPADQAVALPEKASAELGASLGVPALTAYHCLFADGSPKGGVVLVTGGAGSVGHYAIELARWAGARVVSTVSGPAKAELARRAGADLVVNYHDDDVAEQIRAFAPRVDRIVEVALGANLGVDLDLADAGTTIVSYAAGGADPTLPVRTCMTKNVTLRFVLLYGVAPDALRTAAREVTAAVNDGALTELPLHRFSLDDVVAAHEAVESGVTGKVLLDLR
jgi:NADPH2:quinone reductase